MLDKKQKNCVAEIGEWDWKFGLLANVCVVTRVECGFSGDLSGSKRAKTSV